MKSKFLLAMVVVVGFSMLAQAGGSVDCPPVGNGHIITSTAPDGGTTAMLLGCALAGLGLIKRKFLAGSR